jgi:hypothetical protein
MTTEINWGYNCLTQSIHHGRPEAIWNLPMGYAKLIYGPDVLKDLVVARIYNDAMQYVVASPFVQKGTGATTSFKKEWADQVKEYAENWFPRTLRQKLVELDQYYTSSGWKNDIQDVVERVEANKLNPGYQPLHGHDSINMLCRIIGVSCSIEASKDVA